MWVKNFALGFGVAILFPMLVHYGINTFVPPLDLSATYVNVTFSQENMTQQQINRNIELHRQLQSLRETVYQKYAEMFFLFALPIGVAAIIFGLYMNIPGVGAGFIFGGVFTILEAYLLNWGSLNNSMRFVSLLLALSVIVYVAYRRPSPVK